MTIYLIGSLRNPHVTEVARALRQEGYDVFDDWMAAGPEADDYWQRYEQERGRAYPDALEGFAARHVFYYDRDHLNSADMAVLVAPAGKSSHMELGYMLGQGKPGWILMDKEPERWDVMFKFATGVFFDLPSLIVDIDKVANAQRWRNGPREENASPIVSFEGYTPGDTERQR